MIRVWIINVKKDLGHSYDFYSNVSVIILVEILKRINLLNSTRIVPFTIRYIKQTFPTYL